MANEKRLIDANALKNRINALSPHWLAEWSTIGVLAEVDKTPTVDAVEVVHGRWENIRNWGSGECYGWCSHCRTPVKADNATGLVQNNRFCHWCGAKMDGDGNDFT